MGGINVSSPTAVQYSGVAGAITGVVLWLLSTYVFKGTTPAPLEGAAWILIPGAVTYIASLLTRQNTTPAATPPAVSPPLPPEKTTV